MISTLRGRRGRRRFAGRATAALTLAGLLGSAPAGAQPTAVARGEYLAKIMVPWPSYSALTDADAAALVAYLRTLPPARARAPANTSEGQRPPAPYLDVVVPR
ncbi:MAG TPA: hypothetical protein VLD61_11045 [Methylomirabilota bacterium]|nr:hypothetical protein [Methylomirabilota bacterium]